MSDYAIVNGELCHYGVPGMKWGVRRAVKKDANVKAARKEVRKTTKEMDRAFRKADRTVFSRSRRNAAQANAVKKRDAFENAVEKRTQAEKKARVEAEKRLTEQATNKALKKAEKIQAKEIQNTYRKEYLDGKSAVGKVWAKWSGIDKTYAAIKYDTVNVRKKRFNEDTWEDDD